MDDLLTQKRWRLNNLYRIIDKQGKIDTFRFNWAQEELYNSLHTCNIVLKARQLGISTFCCLYILDECLFKPNTQAGIIAHTREDAEYLFKRIKFAYDNLPCVMTSEGMINLRESFKAKNDSARELTFVNNSMIRVGTSMRSSTLNILHLCLSKDTEIVCKDGLIKKIIDVKEDDEVLTSNNSYLPVKYLSKNKLSDINQKMVSLKIFGEYAPLKLTENHKVFVRDGETNKSVWKEAKNLTTNDYIAYPVFETISKHRKGSVSIYKKHVTKNDDIRIKVDENLGYFVGMFLADGHLRNSEITIADDYKNTSTRESFLSNFAEYINSYRIRRHKTSRTECIIINSKILSIFLKNYLFLEVEGKVDKGIPDSLLQWGRPFLHGLLKGYFEGDGYLKNLSEVRATSTRRQILQQIKRIIMSLRLGVPSLYHRKAGNFYNRNCKEIWTLNLSGKSNYLFRRELGYEIKPFSYKQHQWFHDRNIMPSKAFKKCKNWIKGSDQWYVKIKEIEYIDDEEFVYDICLDKSPHNYLTVQGIVSNSEFGKICAQYPSKAEEIITGSLNTVAVGQQIFIESTAEGTSGYFKDMCDLAEEKCKTKKKLSETEYRFYFFPWFKHPEYQLKESVWYPPKMLEYFEQLRGKGINLTEYQKAWYTQKYNIQKDGMLREFPSTSQEAFQASTESQYYARYINQARDEKRVGIFPYDPNALVHTAWDLGYFDAMSVWYFQVTPSGDLRIIDFHETSGQSLAENIQMLKSKPYIYGDHFVPHDAKVHEMSSGLTRLEIAYDLGVNMTVIDRLAVQDGIDLVKSNLPRCWFHEPNTKIGLDHLMNYCREWNAALGRPEERPRHDEHSHSADGFRYLCTAYKKYLEPTQRKQDTTPKLSPIFDTQNYPLGQNYL